MPKVQEDSTILIHDGQLGSILNVESKVAHRSNFVKQMPSAPRKQGRSSTQIEHVDFLTINCA
jgi:hypothetical protein